MGYLAQNIGEDLPPIFRIFDLFFCVVFSAELVIRLFVHRKNFYRLAEWKWNCFDTLLVSMQLIEEIIAVIVAGTSSAPAPAPASSEEEEGAGGAAEEEGGIGMNFSFMRVLRILRLVRIVRLFRVLRVIGELRTIVASIIGCLKPLLS